MTPKQSPRTSPRRGRARGIIAATAISGCLVPAASAAAATDVLFIFDTTGSMGGALDQAKANVSTITADLAARLGDVRFGVAEMRDYAVHGSMEGVAWQVRQAMTASIAEVSAGLSPLVAEGGGDGPEAYGRALFEAVQGDGIGWRAGARHVVVMVGDNVPHDNDLQEGVPQPIVDAGGSPTPWETGVDPGRNAVLGDGDDIDWQGTLAAAKSSGYPLGMVLFSGGDSYLRYWEHWAGLTGGLAVAADSENVVSKMIDVATAAARASATAPTRVCQLAATYTRRSLRLKAKERLVRARLLDGPTVLATFTPNRRRNRVSVTATALKDQVYTVKVTVSRPRASTTGRPRSVTRIVTRTPRATCR